MKYETTVKLSGKLIDKVRNLLSIDDFDDLTEEEMKEIGALEDDYEGVYYAEFDDGSYVDFGIASGQRNYYDDVIWHDPEDKSCIFFDSLFELDDLEFDAQGNEYYIKIERVDE